jgi:hypothetical protein
MNSVGKAVLFWAVIVVSAFLLWQTVKSGSTARVVPTISYSDFLARVASGQVSSVTIVGSVVTGLDAKGSSFRVIAPANQTAMLDALQQHGVDVWFKETTERLAELDTESGSSGSFGRVVVFHDPPGAEPALGEQWADDLGALTGLQSSFWRVTSVPNLCLSVFLRKGLE